MKVSLTSFSEIVKFSETINNSYNLLRIASIQYPSTSVSKLKTFTMKHLRKEKVESSS